MILTAIILATLMAGVGSVWLSAALSYRVVEKHTSHMLSLAAGALLATSLLHLLPESLNSEQDAQTLFAFFLVGVIFFFLLDKAQLWHHGHEHGGHEHHHIHHHVGFNTTDTSHQHLTDASHSHAPHLSLQPASNKTGMGAWSILTGDAVHCFGDGILIASAFMADFKLGMLAAISVLIHETPHHMGDLLVLRSAQNTRQTALIKVSLSGSVTAIGGILGYFLIDRLEELQPFILVLASSSFIYVALADLIPQLQKRLSSKETIVQIIWLLAGIALVYAISWIGGHSH